MPLAVGLAQCSHCGAQVGTLFDEKAVVRPLAKGKPRKKIAYQMDDNQRIEQAQDRANNSSVLALSSFFPLLGLFMGFAAIFLGLKSARTLKAFNVEDGRGSAMAGYTIGAIGIIAQVCLIIYAARLMTLLK
jgi:hypothetical protein